jgi:hypothetical protein
MQGNLLLEPREGSTPYTRVTNCVEHFALVPAMPNYNSTPFEGLGYTMLVSAAGNKFL